MIDVCDLGASLNVDECHAARVTCAAEMPSGSGANSPQPGVAAPAPAVGAGAGERRLSNSSDCSTGSGNTRASSASAEQSGTCAEYLSATATRGRVSRPPPPRPAANPLQFVKVGPADLYRTAQEQLKKAEQVKKSKEVTKVDQEDWQSNLDNWKCSRRKRVEHIIEKVVEVKRLTDEASVAAARRKAKTFNEMLEERAGRRRRCPLALYAEEEATDFSDLGIGTSSTKSSLSEDCDAHSLASDGVELEKNHSDIDNMSGGETERISRKFGSSANEYDTCTTATISSPEPEEYTYEGAIESYKSRVISKTKVAILDSHFNNNLSSVSKDTNGNLPNGNSGKFSIRCADKPLLFESRRTSDVDNGESIKKDIPKVDILKRREMFEKESSPVKNDNIKRSSVDINPSKSIRDRLSSLGKSTEEITLRDGETKRLPSEVSSVRERLDFLKKGALPENDVIKNSNSNGDIFNTRSLKERLSSLQTQAEDQSKVNKVISREYIPSIKERLNSLDTYKSRNSPKSTPERDTFNAKLASYNVEISSDQKYTDVESGIVENNELKSQRQLFHHSMDNFNINNATERTFDRIQSLEDINVNHIESSPLSPNDTDREDSGVHTADGSCAVSQADDGGEINDLSSNIMTDDNRHSKNESMQSFNSRSDQQVFNKTEMKSVSSDFKSDPSTDHSLSESHSTLNSQIERAPSVLEEIHSLEENEVMDKDDEETLKSIEQHDISVSLYDNSTSSVVSDGGDNVVFEGKMLIRVNLEEIRSNIGAGSNNGSTNNTTNLKNNNGGEVTQSNSLRKSTFTVSDICTTPNKPLSDSVRPYHSSNTSLYDSLDSIKSTNSCDYTPSLQRRLRSSLEEPNRRRTILHIKNKISPQPKEYNGPPIFDMPEILPPNLNSNDPLSPNSPKES